jgi:RNA polymerase sigma-70 factor, ECF subfamily
MFQIRPYFERIDDSSTVDECILAENAWVRKIREGDQKAFESLYRFYYPRLGQFLMRYVKCQRAAEDIIHNVFYKIWINRTRLEPNGTLKAYLYTAVRNEALNYLEYEQIRDHSDIDDHTDLQTSESCPEKEIEHKEFKEAVLHVVGQLPKRQRLIFQMHRSDQMTYKTIASVLDISINTVQTQMSRSIKFLSEKLAHFRR